MLVGYKLTLKLNRNQHGGNMNYQEILSELKERGVNHYRINKETGISYKTLQRLRDGVTKNPMASTHNELIRLLERERSK